MKILMVLIMSYIYVFLYVCFYFHLMKSTGCTPKLITWSWNCIVPLIEPIIQLLTSASNKLVSNNIVNIDLEIKFTVSMY